MAWARPVATAAALVLAAACGTSEEATEQLPTTIHAPDTGATVFTVANGDHLLVSPATEGVALAISSPDFAIED